MLGRSGTAVSVQHEPLQWPAASNGSKMTEQVGAAGMKGTTQSGFTSRAPVLARKAPVLAVRCVPADIMRSPVLAAETTTPRSTLTSQALHPSSPVQHPVAENVAQSQQGSQQAPGQWVHAHATTNDNTIDGLRMGVDCAERQASGKGTLQHLWCTPIEEADGLQTLAQCAETSPALHRTARPVPMMQYAQTKTLQSGAQMAPSARNAACAKNAAAGLNSKRPKKMLLHERGALKLPLR